MSRRPLHLPFLFLAACSQSAPTPQEEPTHEPPEEPLNGGDAEWPDAPIPQPGGEGSDEGGDDGLGFTPTSDIAQGSICDPFAQDCPEGEKCVAYASTGGQLDSNKCVPVGGEQQAGEPCIYGGVVEATDDCDALANCWDVDAQLQGTCAAFCMGTADSPSCPPGTSCLIAFDGSVNLCLPDAGEETDTGTDTGPDTGTDTGTDTSTDTGMPEIDPLELAPAPEPKPEPVDEDVCPDTNEPIVLYMSNDDSNSRASPILVRRMIHDGSVVSPHQVRIHEFLNYYDLSYENPENDAVDVGIQMRRTDAERGEFTLLLSAQGRAMRAEDRPPMNIVFSLDTSGSMTGEPIELLKDSMTALAGSLRAGDRVSLVQWSSTQTVLLDGLTVSGPDEPALINAIEGVVPSGSTDLNSGLVSAYALAEQHYMEGGINRVVLVSDGGANAGETDIEVISAGAAEENDKAIYLMGVGVGNAVGYSDYLMDAVTDAGKGAYVFIDSPEEAERMFGERFVSLASVAARNVQMRLTMPWYFGIKVFHGEEFSADPAEVEPQHLAPNDAMSFHQILGTCDPSWIDASDEIEAHVEYLDPLTLEPRSDEFSMSIGELVERDATQLYKADVVVSFAKAIIVIGARWQDGQKMEALTIAMNMTTWLEQAADSLQDSEVEELAELMQEYVGVIQSHL